MAFGWRLAPIDRLIALEFARNLEFEQAARLRDQIEAVRRQGFGLPEKAADRLRL